MTGMADGATLRGMDTSARDTMRRMMAAIEDALVSESQHRRKHKDWVERERFAVATEANRWAAANEGWSTVTVQDVERVERRAMGHIDYGSKLALYVAELVMRRDGPLPAP